MKLLHALSILFLLLSTALAEIGLTAQYFKIEGNSQDNVKLSWHGSPSGKNYIITRKSRPTGPNDQAEDLPRTIAQVQGNTYDDYGVPKGMLTYQVLVDGRPSESSPEVTVESQPPENRKAFFMLDNIQASQFQTKSKIKSGNTFYSYKIESDSNAMSKIVESTSSDGYTFSGERVVLTRTDVCAGSADGFCKLEAVTFVQNAKTSEVVMWAHWENKQDYGQARVAVAYGKPGGRWAFGGSFRPLGNDSRDLSFFADDDGSGYLISSTAMNTNMNIYKLSADWHKVNGLLITVLKGEHREAPSLIKHENFYYLFTSKAAGWYPSGGQYISAPLLSGPWSESRNIGNLAGFGAQSGGVVKLGSAWVMCANQWSGQWLDPEPPNRQIILPISMKNGWADYHFYKSIRYLDDDQQGGVYGIQSGKVLSLGNPSYTIPTAAPDSDVKKVNDGILLDPNHVFKPSSVPFSYLVDLGNSFSLSQFDLTTTLVGGSETAYQFNITCGNSLTETFELVVDKSKNTRVGFVPSLANYSGPCRYVKLNVQRVLNIHNKNEADWAAGVVQFTVYGRDSRTLRRPTTHGKYGNLRQVIRRSNVEARDSHFATRKRQKQWR